MEICHLVPGPIVDHFMCLWKWYASWTGEETNLVGLGLGLSGNGTVLTELGIRLSLVSEWDFFHKSWNDTTPWPLPLSTHEYTQGEGCSYYYRVQKKMGTQAQLRQYGYNTAWDIEDLVQLGKRVRVYSNKGKAIKLQCWVVGVSVLNLAFRRAPTLLRGIWWTRLTLSSVPTITLSTPWSDNRSDSN